MDIVSSSKHYKRNRNTILKFVLLTALVLAEFTFISNSLLITRFFELQLLLVWFFSFYYSIRRFGIFNIFTLQLVTTFIFAIGGVFHYFVSGDNICILENRGFGDFSFSHEIIQKSLLLYTIFIGGTFIVYNGIYDSRIYDIPQSGKYSQNTLFRLGKVLMIVFLGIEIYKGYLFVTSFSTSRVLIYLYGNMDNPVPIWVRFFATFFEVGYFFVVASHPDKGTFKKFSFLYFIAIIPDILLGNRGLFGAFLLFYMWYYFKNFKENAIKTKYIVIGGVFMLFVFQFMEFYRNEISLSESSFSLTSFLVGQSISFYILPVYMLYSTSIQYYSYPFILYTILGGFSGYTGQSTEVLEHKCGVGHQLMYTVNPNYYLDGGSFGSSCITELYDLGVLGVIAGAFFMPLMLKYLDKMMQISPFFRFASFSIFSDLILAPRGSFFPGAYGILKLFIFYKFCLIIYTSLFGRKNEFEFKK